jgi:hypothetical protein
MLSNIPSTKLTSSSITRNAERQQRQQLLIFHLRKVAALASLEHSDTVSFAERSRIARLVERVDEQLRKLCNRRAA